MSDDRSCSQHVSDSYQSELVRQAVRICRGAHDDDDIGPEWLHVSGIAATEQKSPTFAAACLARASALKPLSADYLRDLGEALRDAGRHSEALDAFRNARELVPERADLQCLVARGLADAGRHEEAVTAYAEAIRLDRWRSPTYAALGELLLRAGHVNQAVCCFEMCVRLDEGGEAHLAEDYRLLGRARLATGLWHEASRFFRQSLDVNNRIDRLALARAETTASTTPHTSSPLQPSGASSAGRAVGFGRAQMLDALVGLGATLLALGQFEDALIVCSEAAAIEPGNVEACRQLVCTQELLGLRDDAVAAWTALGVALVDHGALRAAAEAFEAALDRRPECFKALVGLAACCYHQREPGRARELNMAALALRPDDVRTHVSYAFASFQVGAMADGWTHIEWVVCKERDRRLEFEQPQWDGGYLEGRTILLWLDEGIGDTVFLLRYAQIVKARGGIVIIECARTLMTLVGRAPYVDHAVAQGMPLPDFHVQAPLIALPRITGVLGSTMSEEVPAPADAANITIAAAPRGAARVHDGFAELRPDIPEGSPYLKADEQRTRRWRERVGVDAAFKVGLVWASGPRPRGRSVPLVSLAPLAHVPGVRFFSLQRGPQEVELLALPPGFVVEALLDERCTAEDDAALMENLDLIISTDTMVAHLAGALGRPVWTLLPYIADWRWGMSGNATPWYPTMRLFRQHRAGDWDEVVARVRAELEGLVCQTAVLRRLA